MGMEPMSEGVGLPFSVYDPHHIVWFSNIVFTDMVANSPGIDQCREYLET